jgi:DNA-binding CsgD family transcriptional regulator
LATIDYDPPDMKKTTVFYGVALALGAFELQWLENQYELRPLSTEIYIVLLAALFTGVGIWLGRRLGDRPPPASFEKNDRAISVLGLSKREVQVLELLAQGGSNDDIAQRLSVSTSTVKTHLVNVYQKMQVSRRTQAVQKARSLQIIP